MRQGELVKYPRKPALRIGAESRVERCTVVEIRGIPILRSSEVGGIAEVGFQGTP
jgi:hypothetical protein